MPKQHPSSLLLLDCALTVKPLEEIDAAGKRLFAGVQEKYSRKNDERGGSYQNQTNDPHIFPHDGAIRIKASPVAGD
ncbi:MAG: hypothetical protein ISR73_13015 [Gammaproteobacteria bacterium]|nr:hypothetical protein [Gammaproteobacteria bacterium]